MNKKIKAIPVDTLCNILIIVSDKPGDNITVDLHNCQAFFLNFFLQLIDTIYEIIDFYVHNVGQIHLHKRRKAGKYHYYNHYYIIWLKVKNTL